MHAATVDSQTSDERLLTPKLSKRCARARCTTWQHALVHRSASAVRPLPALDTDVARRPPNRCTPTAKCAPPQDEPTTGAFLSPSRYPRRVVKSSCNFRPHSDRVLSEPDRPSQFLEPETTKNAKNVVTMVLKQQFFGLPGLMDTNNHRPVPSSTFGEMVFHHRKGQRFSHGFMEG